MQIVLQSAEGYFLRFAVSDIPEKKKAAIGVRAMKLGAKDSLEAVYLVGTDADQPIIYKEKEIPLQRLKLAGRDQKGTKLRL
jgi:DNA gyrase subunit A